MKPGLCRVWLFYVKKFIAKRGTSSKLKKKKKKRKETKAAIVKQ